MGGAGGYTTVNVAVTLGQVLGVIVGVGGGEGYSFIRLPAGEGGYGGHHWDTGAGVNERGGGDGSGNNAGVGGGGLTSIFTGSWV